MEANGKNGKDFMKGILVGSVLAGLAAVLFAPKSGKELRDGLKQAGSEAANRAIHVSEETQAKARAILEDARRRAEELKREADRQLAEARQKAREALKAAEEKASQVRELARETIEEATREAKRLKAAVEAGVEAAKSELSKDKETPKPMA